MQSSLRRTVYSVSTLNKHIVRSVAVNNAVSNTNEEVKHLKTWKEIPGPSSLPIIGPMLHFLPGGMLSDIGPEMAHKIYKEFGPIVRLDGMFGSAPLIFLLEAETSAHILRSENWMPIRPGFNSLEYYRSSKKTADDEPTGLITDHGEVWKKFRSTVNPIMLQPKTIKLYAETLEEVANDMITRMRTFRNEKNTLEGKFDTEMNLWALESIAVVALGGRLNCFDTNLNPDSPEKRLIQLVNSTFDNLNKLDFKPSLWRYISTPLFRKAMREFEEQENLNKFFIEKAKQKLKSKNNNLNEEKGVLEKLLEIDEKVAIIMASDMLFAGVDTAANTIIATLYLLAKNPEKQNKLREEILSNEGKGSYLKACIKESMRMMPVVSGNLRKTSKEYDILGYRIPKDMLITFGHHFLSACEEHFPRPSEYIPERWTTDKSDPLYHGKAHPFAFSPFGFGTRSCIGRRIAELEIETFLAKLIQNFHVGWFGPPPKIKPSTLNYIVGPFNFTFQDV